MILTRIAAIAALGTVAAGCASVSTLDKAALPAPATPEKQAQATPPPLPAPVPMALPAPLDLSETIVIEEQTFARTVPYTSVAPQIEIAHTPVFEPFTAVAPQALLDIAPVPQYEAILVAPVTDGTREFGSMKPIRDDDQTPRQAQRERRVARSELSAPPPSELLREASLRPGDFGGFATRQHIYDRDFASRLADAAEDRLKSRVRYDGRYVEIAYPWGDIPDEIGVCTDVVIRSYRALGIDLQQLVHEDMKRAFRAYPSKRIYGLSEPDSNIDHRRVVNLEAFLTRHGESLTPSTDREAYRPGDLVTWRISGTQPHIGIVSDKRDRVSGNLLVVHNIGAGPRADDILFTSPPVGHYRFTPTAASGVRVASR